MGLFQEKSLQAPIFFWVSIYLLPTGSDLERPLTFFMIMILLSQRTEFPFVGKILRPPSSRLD